MTPYEAPREGEPRPLPSGTVTFMMTDIEGSTTLWEQHPAAMKEAIRFHDEAIETSVAPYGSLMKAKGEGDSTFSVFIKATDALSCALQTQQALLRTTWPLEARIRVRIAIHTGEAELREFAGASGDYFGSTINRCARIRAIAHGEQVLISQATHNLVRDLLLEGVGLKDLGPHRLKDLERPERIHQLTHPELPGDFPPLRSLDALPHNLPVQLTSFVGRDEELHKLRNYLSTSRLLTLLGPGGSGKTRLALQLAAEFLEGTDGVWMVDLSAIIDPSLIPHEAASALGLREEPGRQEIDTVIDHLSPKQCLIVLDNCEHLIEGCAVFANRLMKGCPQLLILATSREALGVPGEATWRVLPLSAPDPEHLPSVARMSDYESVRLFLDRAGLVRPGLSVSEDNAASIAQICHRLDGIPLAIELAAAKVQVLSLDAIATRLDDRFKLLTGGARGNLTRHQTLRATVDWSYDLLGETAQAILRRLAVFAGAWSLEAAEEVCAGAGIDGGDVIDLLSQLVTKSLVSLEEEQGLGRYRMLETIQHYAGEKLAQSEEESSVNLRHLHWCLALAEQGDSEFQAGRLMVWLDRMELERDNLRIALTRGLAEDELAELGLRLTVGAARFWKIRGPRGEGQKWLEDAVARNAAGPLPARLDALAWAANLASDRGELERADSIVELALDLANREGADARQRASLLDAISLHESFKGNYEVARRLNEESTTLFRELGDRTGESFARWRLGQILIDMGNLEGLPLIEEALKDRAASDIHSQGSANRTLGEALLFAGDLSKSAPYLEKSLEFARTAKCHDCTGNSLNALSNLALRKGDAMAASGFDREALDSYAQIEYPAGIVLSLEGLAAASADQSDLETSAILFAAAAGLRERLSYHRIPSWQKPTREAALDRVRNALVPATLDRIWKQGSEMSLSETLELGALREVPGEAG